MYSRVSSMLRGSGRIIRRATTTGSLPLSKSLLGTRRGCPAQHELPAARGGAGKPIEVVGAWSDVTARKQLAEALADAQERLVHLLSCDIEREPAGVAQLAAAGSSLDRHEIVPLTDSGRSQ